ncbi:MAG: lipopolysaccharide biosynthesis protein [Bacteroidales bacterium]|nr:lipopolysaccharide biosynthesis protein [Bacteroidales bacterium]
MDQNYNYNTPQEEEEGIDIMALVKQLWDGRKTIIIVTAVFMVLGLVAALTMKRTYTVSTVMVPQMSSRSNSSLSSLASLAGFDLGLMNNTGGDISPLVYPQIVSSVPFRKELIYTPFHYEKADTAVTMFTYAKEYAKPSVMSYVLKYTIGLPGVILGALRKEKPEMELPSSGEGNNDEPKPILLSKDEAKLMKVISQNVGLSVDKKEGYITLSVVGSEPIQTAEMALKAQQLLQSEVTRFRTEKAQYNLDYIQARYDEIKKEAESYQAQLATVRDRSQNMATTRARIEQERIQSKYNVANSIYAEMAKQLEQAKMQVKRDTPVLAVLQPVTVPNKPSNSRAKTLIVWTFLGGILGCGIVLGKSYLPKIKESFQKTGEAKEE